MATKNHNLSQFDSPLPSAAEMRFGIVVAEWNREVTEALLEGAVRTLRAAGCPDLNIQIKYVPGTFELALGAQFFAEYTDVDAVIALGCVIQGDTRHFDFICQGVTVSTPNAIGMFHWICSWVIPCVTPRQQGR